MSTWRIWGETGRIMAALCLITALAAVTAALILLVHEDLTERLSGRVKKGIGKKTGILALTAAGVWILVLGQSVTAAELPAENSGAAVSGNLENGAVDGEGSSAGAGSTSREIAPEVEPGSVPDPIPDENPPEITIQMSEEIAGDENGLIYCRADNAGFLVTLADDREGDLGIVSYSIVMADSAGMEIRIENDWEDPLKQETVIEVGAEKTAELSEGLIRVMPDRKEAITANLTAWKGRLTNLDEELKQGLKDLPRKDIITFHEAFPYFAEAYGLRVAAVVNKEPGETVSPAQMARLAETIRSLGNPPLFVEPQYEDLSARVLASETGAPVYTLDPVVTGPEENPPLDYYETVMRQNMETLRGALGQEKGTDEE